MCHSGVMPLSVMSALCLGITLPKREPHLLWGARTSPVGNHAVPYAPVLLLACSAVRGLLWKVPPPQAPLILSSRLSSLLLGNDPLSDAPSLLLCGERLVRVR